MSIEATNSGAKSRAARSFPRSHIAAAEPALASAMWHVSAGEGLSTPELAQSTKADVLIIGGGFNGVSAALRLAELGLDACLLEAGEIGEGASGRNAGMVNPGQFLGPEAIGQALGSDYGEVFLRELGGAPDLVRQMIARHDIDCAADFRPVIRAASDRASERLLSAECAQWQSRGQPVDLLRDADLRSLTGSERWRVAMMDHRGFTIQPLAFVRGLARAAQRAGARLHQNSAVLRLWRADGVWNVETRTGVTLKAPKVILATNAYSSHLHPAFAETLVTCGAYGVATRPLSSAERAQILPRGHSLYDTHRIPLFFRYDRDGRLMIGSLGFLSDGRAGPEAWARRALARLWPEIDPPGFSHVWQGTLGLTSHHMPRLIAPEEGLIGTIGCNGRGIAPNVYFGTMLADMVAGHDGPRPLPIETRAPISGRALRRDLMDLGMRIYRNTLLLN